MSRHVPRRRASWRAGILAVAVGVVAATTTTSLTAYTATTGTAASVATASCFNRASVQRGSTTSTADGVTSVTISPVDPSRAFLMFTTRHALDRPVVSSIGGHLASSTTLEFVRETDEPAPVTVTIEWSVIEYSCGVSVQRGTTSQTSTAIDVSITPVPSTAQAFVLWSKTAEPTDQHWGDNDPVVADLPAVDRLQFRVGVANAIHTIWWQVVAFTDPTVVRVQRGSTALTGGALSVDVTTPLTFSRSRSFLLVDIRLPGSSDLASAMVRGRLTADGTVSIDRSGGTIDVTEVGWQVVELFDGTSVQSGTTSFSSGGTTGNAFLVDPVDLARTSAAASTQTGGGQNGGRTTFTSNDTVGVAAFALRLTSTTNLELRRDHSAASGASANVAFFVVSWGLPT